VNKFIKFIIFVLIIVVIYSIIPYIVFLFSPPAGKDINNDFTVKKLQENKGSYFSFIVFGDNHSGLFLNDAAAIKEIWHINREDRFRKVPIDFVLSTGDITLDGKVSHFKSLKKIQNYIKYPFIATIGNHDNRSLFEEYCGAKEFTFVNRNSFFIILDNEIGSIKGKQFIWLEKQLRKGKEYDNIFISMHKPPFDPYQQDWYNVDNHPWAYRFRKLCAEYGVRIVFSGHKHMFKHENFDGVDYIVTGGGGMLIELPENDGGYLHYIRVMVNNDYVTYEVRKISPPLWEYIIFYFWKEAVYWIRNLYGSGYIFVKNTKLEPLRVEDINKESYWTP